MIRGSQSLGVSKKTGLVLKKFRKSRYSAQNESHFDTGEASCEIGKLGVDAQIVLGLSRSNTIRRS